MLRFNPSYAAIPSARLGLTPISAALETIYCDISRMLGAPPLCRVGAPGVPGEGSIAACGTPGGAAGAPPPAAVGSPVWAGAAGAPGNGATPLRSILTDPPSAAAIEKCIASFDERQLPPHPNPYFAAIAATFDGISVTRPLGGNVCGLALGLISIATPSEWKLFCPVPAILRLAYPPMLLILYPLFSSSSTNPLKLAAYCCATTYFFFEIGETSSTIPGTLERCASGDGSFPVGPGVVPPPAPVVGVVPAGGFVTREVNAPPATPAKAPPIAMRLIMDLLRSSRTAIMRSRLSNTS